MTQAEVRKMFIQHNPGFRIPGRKGYWYKCAHCGRLCGRAGGERANLQDYEKMEVDHIRPWSQGGSDSIFNLQALCKSCNRSKSANPTFGDNIKGVGNAVFHPVDTFVSTPLRKAARQNKILKGLGITKRR
jgi:hypothetical protein